MADQTRVPISSDADIVLARQKGRELAVLVGFHLTDQTLIATVISELARNIVVYAKRGELLLKPTRDGNSPGITIEANDQGPGIWNVEQAMQVGYSTSGSLGLGLPGVKRLMDEFKVTSKVGVGTKITATKWKR